MWVNFVQDKIGFCMNPTVLCMSYLSLIPRNSCAVYSPFLCPHMVREVPETDLALLPAQVVHKIYGKSVAYHIPSLPRTGPCSLSCTTYINPWCIKYVCWRMTRFLSQEQDTVHTLHHANINLSVINQYFIQKVN